MLGGKTGRRVAPLFLGLAVLPLGAVVASCSAVIGLAGIERVECVLDCGVSADVVVPDASGDALAHKDGGKHTDSGTRVDTGQPPCTADTQCTTAASPRCDVSTGACVACLPQNDNCPTGQICKAFGAGYQCATGCNTVADCPTDGGAAGDSSGSVEGGVEGGGGGGVTLACCDQVCVDTSSNVADCGGCGQACSSENITTPLCTAGVCAGTCTTGFSDCDHDKLTNGCETNIEGTDIMNCGGCGTICSSANIATVTCTAGVCDGACNSGFADCNMNKQSDGCEIDTATSASNCGACGTPCSGNNIPMVTCGGGVCDGACAAGFSDCDHDKLMNGCEVDTNTSATNCGSCGRVCGGSIGCVGGACIGCLTGGVAPPPACTAGTESNGSPWVVCTSSCSAAWLSSTRGGGSNLYSALAICNSLGYASVLNTYAGNCGDTCSTCTAGTSCSAPGTSSFTGLTMGAGDVISSTVEWECLP